MFFSVLAAEHSKVFSRKILWVELAILASLVALLNFAQFVLAPSLAGSEAPQITWGQAVVDSLLTAANPQFGGLLIVILVGAVVAQEYAWRTVHMVLSLGISRPLLLGAKFAALLLPALLFVVVALLVGGSVAAIFSYLLAGGLDLGQVNYAQLAFGVFYGAYALLPYAALAFMLAIVGRSTVVAIAAGVGIVLGESVLWQLLHAFGGTGAQVAQVLPSSLSMSITSLSEGIANVAMTAAPQATPELLGPGLAAVGIAAYTIVALIVAGLAFVRQDLTG